MMRIVMIGLVFGKQVMGIWFVIESVKNVSRVSNGLWKVDSGDLKGVRGICRGDGVVVASKMKSGHVERV